ncbi:MAG: DUF819 family protein [Bacteroidia bacterium]|nr:DUF819 family protein [Bacteroidia bacterium]
MYMQESFNTPLRWQSFFFLLNVKLKDLRYAGLPMLAMFIAGSICTVIGVLAGYFITQPQHHDIQQSYAVAGMYTGTYTGGSVNLNAVALQYGVNKEGTLFAAINAVDNIVGTTWIMITLVLPSFLQKFFPREKKLSGLSSDISGQEAVNKISFGKEEVTVPGISILLALGFGSLFLSNLLSQYIPQIPSILTLTTLALILAQIPFIQKINGARVMGYFLVLVFLAVIGAFCDFKALSQSGDVAGLLLLWVSILIIIHGVLIFFIGGLFKQDWDLISIASNANVGGTATAAVCAASLGRKDLELPGLLAASVGNAAGTYLGIMVAELLK